MYENIFNDVVSRKKRKCIEEPTNWKEITKYYVVYGDIRNNTLRKFYILGKLGFISGFSIAASETYIHPHPKNPAGGTARFFAYSLWKRIPVGMKRWTNTYDFMPWAILLGFVHLFPYRQDLARRRLTQIKLSNPHHYEFDMFGNYIKPLTGINYNFDDDV
uniref:Transmembrane protein n=1 Tax=Magallana gigas TaxID=29159 RepID=A0A8W8JVQ3_MAGGI